MNWQLLKDAPETLKDVVHYILHWQWVKRFLYWLIMSAGMVAELCFLLASLWMCLNSSIHNFILLFLTEGTTIHISEIGTAAYVGLPELILFLASVMVINHFRMWLYTRNKIVLTWAVAYAVPTLVFLILSLFTLGSSVLNVHFVMPPYFVVARALAGYIFGFVAFLYWQLGQPQEVDRLKQKDAIIEELKTQVNGLEIDLQESENAHKALLKELENRPEHASEDILSVWLNYTKDRKTVTIEEIIRITGVTKRSINAAIAANTIRASGRNTSLLLVSTVSEWLKEEWSRQTQIIPALHVI